MPYNVERWLRGTRTHTPDEIWDTIMSTRDNPFLGHRLEGTARLSVEMKKKHPEWQMPASQKKIVARQIIANGHADDAWIALASQLHINTVRKLRDEYDLQQRNQGQ